MAQLHSSTFPSHATAPKDAASKMPPFQTAAIGDLKTFHLPATVSNNEESNAIASEMIQEWRRIGIFQIHMTPDQSAALANCFEVSKDFFQQPFTDKSKHVDDKSFAGYIASGEELTDNIADYSEIFTITKDLKLSDSRVENQWPCHGPTPWPNEEYKKRMNILMGLLGESGDKLLQLVGLGLGLGHPDDLLNMTKDGWHHMRVLRFPRYNTEQSRPGRGIGSHTDYGLLVIAAQDDVGGLFIRPRAGGENVRNWELSAAGKMENDPNWLFIPPVEDTLTVFPGDMMQLLTNDFLPSTLHKVGLNTDERYAFAYFHEPNFSEVLEILPKFRERIHYGSHFTNMFLRSYPQRVTTKRIKEEGRMEVLNKLRSEAFSK